MIKLNETPVRTSKSFNINNIKLSDIKIPKNISKFDNVKIEGDLKVIETKKTPIDLKYGLGEDLTNEVIKNANQNYNIEIDESLNLIFNFDFDEENKDLVENIDITAEENINTTIILKYKSNNNLECYHNGIIKLFAKKDSKVNIVIINLLNDISNNFLSIENKIEENSNVNYTIVDFGGKNSVTNYYSNVMGDFAKNNLNTIYIGKDKRVLDLNYIAELYGKKSNVNIEVQGALKDKAKKNFKGTIDFKKGCKKAKGEENENCMLLSDTAKSIALPMLLCSEEDVEGAHSASAGKVGNKELFYIMSRGFNLKEAEKLLVRANFNNILDNIKDEEIKEEILKEIDWRLD